MEEELEYGPVLVTKGKYKGHIGIYDDDDENDTIVVFPNEPVICGHFYTVKKTSVSPNIPTDYLVRRIDTLYNTLCHHAYGLKIDKHYSAEEIIDVLHESMLCSDLLTDRYFHSMLKLTDSQKANVFISHASIDLSHAACIASDLIEAGFSVFLDDWSINVGDRIFEKINGGLEESAAFVMVISQDYLKSVCCNDEWAAFYGKALHNEKCRIYPIIIDDSDPPLLLSQIKYLRTLDNPDYVYQLIKGLHQQFAKPEKISQESSL